MMIMIIDNEIRNKKTKKNKRKKIPQKLLKLQNYKISNKVKANNNCSSAIGLDYQNVDLLRLMTKFLLPSPFLLKA